MTLWEEVVLPPIYDAKTNYNLLWDENGLMINEK
jgi:hypothetical protein